jgi:hypothetical protein
MNKKILKKILDDDENKTNELIQKLDEHGYMISEKPRFYVQFPNEKKPRGIHSEECKCGCLPGSMNR